MTESLSAAGPSAPFVLAPGERATFAVSGSFTGIVTLERSEDRINWKAIQIGAADTGFSGAIVPNAEQPARDVYYRFVADGPDPETAFSGEAVVEFTVDPTAVVEELVHDRRGTAMLSKRQDGALVVPGVLASAVDLATVEAVTTNGDEATAVGLGTYQTRVTTGGSEGAEDLAIGDGTGAIVGQRKLITLAAITAEGDSVALDDTNISQGSDTITGVALDAEGEFLLLEWRGATWEVLAASSGVVATA